MSNNIQKYNSKELATKAVMHALMKAGIKVHLATPEMFAKDMSEHRDEIETQINEKNIEKLHKMQTTISNWIKYGSRNQSFQIKLPASVQNAIKKLLNRDIDKHYIESNTIFHSSKKHSINNSLLNPKSIPLRMVDYELIPYIMTAPDEITKGSVDSYNRESIRFKKNLSNGYVLIVEKEKINNPQAMGTITMWAESSSNVPDAREIRPQGSTSETVVIGLDDIAKIIKDAENAIREDVKNQIDKQINYFYALEGDNTTMAIDGMVDDLVIPCRKNGTLYGWTFNDNIYLTPEGINPETPVHEYTHLWSGSMMIRNPEQWESIKTLLMESEEWGKVIEDPLYTSISDDEDRVASETLARLSGRNNQDLLVHYAEDTLNGHARVDERGVINKMLDATVTALKQFWGWVGKNIFHIPELQSVRQVTDKVLGNLLQSTPLEQTESKHNQSQYSIRKETGQKIGNSLKNKIIDLDDPSILEKNPFDKNIVTSPTIINYRGGLGIRCKVNGIQHSAEPLSATEIQKYNRLLQSGNVDELKKYTVHLAERHFGDQTEEVQQNRGFKR